MKGRREIFDGRSDRAVAATGSGKWLVSMKKPWLIWGIRPPRDVEVGVWKSCEACDIRPVTKGSSRTAST